MSWSQELQREARRRGLAWDDVRGVFEQLWEGEKLKRERANEVRQTAWFYHRAAFPLCWPFWRHGFVSRWGARVERADYTVIPGYDELWQEVSWRFPEYAHDGGCQELWDFLLAPYDKLPEREEVYRRAIELVEAARQRERKSRRRRNVAVPF